MYKELDIFVLDNVGKLKKTKQLFRMSLSQFLDGNYQEIVHFHHDTSFFSSGESVLDLCYFVFIYGLVNVPGLVMINQLNMH